MKILLVHNYYRSDFPSGENEVFEAEREMLESRGHEVFVHKRHSDELASKGAFGTLLGALSTPWNPWETRRLSKIARTFRPDIIHAHNTFPLISPAIFQSVRGDAAKVLTLHNYRLFCPTAMLFRNSSPCTLCIEKKSVRDSLRYGCYRDSRVATLPIATSVALHRTLGTWKTKVESFIALSEFQRQLVTQSGLPSQSVYVKPNFFRGKPELIRWEDREPVVVFAGRLSPEKGIKTLIHAWRRWQNGAPVLKIIGDGILRTELTELANELPVRFLGYLSNESTIREIAKARLLVVPSEWFECFPRVIIEAFAHGTPVAVSDIGSLGMFVTHHENGIVFQSGNSESLYNSLVSIWNAPDKLRELSLGALKEFSNRYTESAIYEKLMHIYREARLKVSTRQS